LRELCYGVAVAEWAPIVVFAYDRPDHLRRTIEALRGNDGSRDSALHVFLDGPKRDADEATRSRIEATRRFAARIDGFRALHIVEREENLGLARSVIAGVSLVLSGADRVVVLEDDILTSPQFLRFMNLALSRYEGDRAVMSVTGWCYPRRVFRVPEGYAFDAFFAPRSCSWGWGTWRAAWSRAVWTLDELDPVLRSAGRRRLLERGGADLVGMLLAQREGRIDSWAVRWSFSHFLKGAYCVYPTASLADNIGFDGSGVHCLEAGPAPRLGQDRLSARREFSFPTEARMDRRIATAFERAHPPAGSSLLWRLSGALLRRRAST
jgi:hypothetical protein